MKKRRNGIEKSAEKNKKRRDFFKKRLYLRNKLNERREKARVSQVS